MMSNLRGQISETFVENNVSVFQFILVITGVFLFLHFYSFNSSFVYRSK